MFAWRRLVVTNIFFFWFLVFVLFQRYRRCEGTDLMLDVGGHSLSANAARVKERSLGSPSLQCQGKS